MSLSVNNENDQALEQIAPQESSFDADIDRICKYIQNSGGHFPQYWKIRTDEGYEKLFRGIQKRNLSEFMGLFDTGVQLQRDIIADMELHRQKEEAPKRALPPLKTRQEYEKMTVKQLKEELESRNIHNGAGRKAELINRLFQ